jgi:hypothetical protein
MSGKRDSNPRPSAWEADALPTELLPLVLFLEIKVRVFRHFLMHACKSLENEIQNCTGQTAHMDN